MQLQLCIVWGREGTGSCSCDTKVSPGFTPSLEMDATLSSQCVAVPTKYIKIINNYWRRLSKISWIFSGKQIINIGSPSLFFEYLWEAIEAMCHFQARAIARRRKVWFHLLMSRILLDNIAHEQTIILFVGSYLQVAWWLLANEKEKISSNDIDNY